jgi:hypothetical protein
MKEAQQLRLRLRKVEYTCKREHRANGIANQTSSDRIADAHQVVSWSTNCIASISGIDRFSVVQPVRHFETPKVAGDVRVDDILVTL